MNLRNNDPIDVVYWIRGKEHALLAAMSIASVHRVYRQATIYVYTDDPANTPHMDGTLRCVLPSGRPAMVANLDAQVTHMLTADPARRVLFLDTDTLVRKPFPFVADLNVTWREHEGMRDGVPVVGVAAYMPYNYGVIAAIACASVSEAFIWMRARVLNMGESQRAWYGNQLALVDLVGSPVSGGKLKAVKIRWSDVDSGTEMDVCTQPCEVWNYTPEAADEDVSTRGILHMKGARKDLMAAYAEQP